VNWKPKLVALTPARFRPYWERLSRSPLGQRLVRGAFWSISGGFVSRGLALWASVIVARLLKKDVFGELGMVQSTLGMFTVFAGVGMGVTATKHVAEFRLRDPERAGRIIALSNQAAWVASLFMALVMFCLASWLARVTLRAPNLEAAVRVSSGLLLLSGINGAQTGTLAGLEAFRAIARLNLITGLVSFPILLAGTWWHGLEGNLWAMGVTTAIGCGLNHAAVRRETRRAGIPTSRYWRRDDLPVLWKFTLPSALATVMVGPVHWVCCTLLFIQPGGRGEMGAFNGTNQWFNALLFLPTLLGQSVLPMMAEQLGSAGKHQGLRLMKLSIKLNSLVALPMLLLSLISPWIMGLYGHGFRGEWPTLVVVLVTAALLAVQTPVGQMITASGNIWPGFWMNLGWAAVYLASTWFLLSWGALGLATARLVAYLVHAVWTTWYAFRLLARTTAT